MKSIRDVYKIGKGPSSSHTMGPERAARLFLSKYPDAETYRVVLYGSLSKTGRGHGTDRALVAGLLGMQPDDDRIPHSFSIAKEAGLHFKIGTTNLRGAHPNTAVLTVESADGRKLELQAASTGGGRIRVDRLDGVEVSFTGIFNTLVVRHQDVAGELSRILNELSVSGVNIANMSLNRDRRGGAALTVVETDQKIPADALERIQALYGVLGATYYEKEED